jgi:hypothetical protein
MRKFMLASFYMILFTPLFLTAASTAAYDVEGLWFAYDGYDKISIDEKRDGLKIRGIDGDRDNRIFKYVGNRTFIDHRGNEVRIVSPYKIIYESNRYRDRIAYYRNDRSAHYNSWINKGRYGRYDDDDCYRGERDDRYDRRYDSSHNGRRNSDYNNDDRDYNRDYDRYNRRGNERSLSGEVNKSNNLKLPSDGYKGDLSNKNFETRNLEGTWSSNSPARELALVHTREGFKIKYRGDTNWVSYTRTENDTYTDDQGNTYSYKSPTVLEWRSIRDNKKIVLRKQSNEVNY